MNNCHSIKRHLLKNNCISKQPYNQPKQTTTTKKPTKRKNSILIILRLIKQSKAQAGVGGHAENACFGNIPSHSLCPLTEPCLLEARQVRGTVLGTQRCISEQNRTDSCSRRLPSQVPGEDKQ